MSTCTPLFIMTALISGHATFKSTTPSVIELECEIGTTVCTNWHSFFFIRKFEPRCSLSVLPFLVVSCYHLDKSNHSFVYPFILQCRNLKIIQLKLLGELLAFFCAYLPLIDRNITFISDKYDSAIWICMVFNLLQPFLYILERFSISHWIGNDSPHRFAVVCHSDGIILFLSCCVIKTDSNWLCNLLSFLILEKKWNGFSIISDTHCCFHVFWWEFPVCINVRHASLANITVANDDDFESFPFRHSFSDCWIIEFCWVRRLPLLDNANVWLLICCTFGCTHLFWKKYKCQIFKDSK